MCEGQVREKGWQHWSSLLFVVPRGSVFFRPSVLASFRHSVSLSLLPFHS